MKKSDPTYLIYAIRLAHDLSHEFRYVGLTSNFNVRSKKHLSESKNINSSEYDSPKYRWMRKHYGNVVFEVLEICSSYEEMVICEMKWIHLLNLRGHRLLNTTVGGEGTMGRVTSERSSLRYKQSKTGAKNPMYGKFGPLSHLYGGEWVTEDFRENRSESQSNLWKDPEYRKKMSESHKGKANPDQSKISALVSHNRWHVDRQIVIGTCKLCIESGLPLSSANAINSSRVETGNNISAERREAQAEIARKVAHVRWHINRGISKPDCILCQ